MSLVKTIRLGFLHVALAITFVAINGVLNRLMIHDLAIPASIVAALVVLPYVLSPMQVWLGAYSDRHPLFGYRRTPYIAVGLILSMGGMALTPYAALLIAEQFWLGLLVGLGVFLIWGIGYNLAVVGYLSLASDLFPERERSRVIAVMWFMMIISLIFTAILMGRALEPYSDAQLLRVFALAGLTGIGLMLLGLVGLEPRHHKPPAQERHSQQDALRAVFANSQARLFFIYLILLLTALLGPDLLLEPFGAQAFGMNVEQTTQLTATWGGATLAALLLYGLLLNRWMTKKPGALLGGILATVGLCTISVSGIFQIQALFLVGIITFGLGTGIATSTNLALMLDMTTPEQVGLFIGAWGFADSLARGAGSLLGGLGLDILNSVTGNTTISYAGVFFIEALMLAVSLVMLRSINIQAFREEQPTLTQVVALAGDT